MPCPPDFAITVFPFAILRHVRQIFATQKDFVIGVLGEGGRGGVAFFSSSVYGQKTVLTGSEADALPLNAVAVSLYNTKKSNSH